jgi:hypothetical protein
MDIVFGNVEVFKALADLTMSVYGNFATSDAARVLWATCADQPDQPDHSAGIDVDNTDLTFSHISMMDPGAAASSGPPVWIEYFVEKSKDCSRGNRYQMRKVFGDQALPKLQN